ncbi:MAG: hypothetical protein M1840_003420 [Geoglossum simile]|nr:MAG: hypothetical protein M1840_003420 [Geoglossum simile]
MEHRGGIGRNFLTRHNGPHTSLLKTIGGQPTRRSPATDDEPQSSADEAGDKPSLPPPLKPCGVGPGSAMDRRRAKRIRGPKYHGTKTATLQDLADEEAAAGPTAQPTNSGPVLTASSRRSTRKLTALSSSPKRSLDEMQGMAEAHLRDDFGFIGSSQTQRKTKRTNTYSSQDQSSQQPPDNKCKSSRQGSGSGFMNPMGRHNLDIPEKLESKFASGAFKDPSKKFAAQLRGPAKEEERTSTFRMPQNLLLDILSSSPEDQGREFKMPLNAPANMKSSSQEDQGPKFKVPKAVPLSPPRKFKMPVGLPIENSDIQDVHKVTKAMLGRPRDLREAPNDSDTILSNDTSSKPFVLTEASNSSCSSPLSSPPDSPVFVSSQEAQGGFTGKRDIFVDNHTARCPMCREAVDADFLSSFNDGRAMNVRKQTMFCRAHKQESAKVEWEERGYPDINWDDLQSRIKKYYSELEDILEGRTWSYFKESFELNFKSGKNRTLAQSIMSPDFRVLTPGYYGSRGARIMMDSIMSKFTDRMRKLAPKDRLISSGGISSFVQTVMVPELAVLLVQEDMGLDSDMARKVLADSIDIGDLLNEDDDDDIR